MGKEKLSFQKMLYYHSNDENIFLCLLSPDRIVLLVHTSGFLSFMGNK